MFAGGMASARRRKPTSTKLRFWHSSPFRRAAMGRLQLRAVRGRQAIFTAARAESARGIAPRAAHRSGLDTLASSGSCHRTKAAAFRRRFGFLPVDPVDPSSTAMACSLRSTGVTPLLR